MDELDMAQARIEAETERAIAARVQCAGESAEDCQECGAEIPQARRLAVPGVELCVGCAAVAEQVGRHRRG